MSCRGKYYELIEEIDMELFFKKLILGILVPLRTFITSLILSGIDFFISK